MHLLVTQHLGCIWFGTPKHLFHQAIRIIQISVLRICSLQIFLCLNYQKLWIAPKPLHSSLFVRYPSVAEPSKLIWKVELTHGRPLIGQLKQLLTPSPGLWCRISQLSYFSEAQINTLTPLHWFLCEYSWSACFSLSTVCLSACLCV